MAEPKVRQELDEDGSGSGVELEESSDAGGIDEPFDPDEIDVITRPTTIGLMMSRLESGALNLQPDFQRKAGVWDDRRQSRLIESLLLRIPLPSFYVSENKAEDWEVIDGIQRLTAIGRYVRPDLHPHQPELVLKGLEYLGSRFEGKPFKDLEPRLSRRILETQVTVHVIRHGTPDDVRFNIFARLNTGGMPLTHQELRHALVPGNARKILKDWADSPSFKLATDDSVSSSRMADREMVLRYLAFMLTDPARYAHSDFNKFLIRAMKSLNELSDAEVLAHWERFQNAMTTAVEVFGKDAFRKRFDENAARNPVNKALFEAVAVNLAHLSDGEQAMLAFHRDRVRKGIIELMHDAYFASAVSQGTGDIGKVKYRFSKIATLFKECLV